MFPSLDRTSASGVEAFDQFFPAMPVNSGARLCSGSAPGPNPQKHAHRTCPAVHGMKVFEIQDGMNIKPNTVFVIPPNNYVAVLHGKLHLIETPAPPGMKTPIDFFFRSLAQDRKDKAICIVLSGSGSEGAMGLLAIKGEGGMGMVRAPRILEV